MPAGISSRMPLPKLLLLRYNVVVGLFRPRANRTRTKGTVMAKGDGIPAGPVEDWPRVFKAGLWFAGLMTYMAARGDESDYGVKDDLGGAGQLSEDGMKTFNRLTKTAFVPTMSEFLKAAAAVHGALGAAGKLD